MCGLFRLRECDFTRLESSNSAISTAGTVLVSPDGTNWAHAAVASLVSVSQPIDRNLCCCHAILSARNYSALRRWLTLRLESVLAVIRKIHFRAFFLDLDVDFHRLLPLVHCDLAAGYLYQLQTAVFEADVLGLISRALASQSETVFPLQRFGRSATAKTCRPTVRLNKPPPARLRPALQKCASRCQTLATLGVTLAWDDK
jgi:hypothetical protein